MREETKLRERDVYTGDGEEGVKEDVKKRQEGGRKMRAERQM